MRKETVTLTLECDSCDNTADISSTIQPNGWYEGTILFHSIYSDCYKEWAACSAACSVKTVQSLLEGN